jgi:glycosyltransferase involved in cell wall biosynthesis
MDLHPDASMALGRMSRKSLLTRALDGLSSFIFRQADQVVVLGEYMADRVALKNVPIERITTIPVWSQRDEIYPTPRDSNPLRKSLGLDGAFVVMYSGNLGLAHSFDEFIEAARRLRGRTDIVFLFVGDGPRLAEVKNARDSEQLPNIRLLDYVPRGQLQASLALADVHLISMRPEMTGIVVPGKLYGVMAAGRPAIFVGPEHCESADTIRDAGCGIAVTPGDNDGLVRAISHLAADPSLARRMGEKGRSAFLAAHEQKLCCARWQELISVLVSRPETRRWESGVAAPRRDSLFGAAAPHVTLSQ